MQKFTFAFLVVALMAATAGNLRAEEAVTIPRTIDVNKLSEFDANALYGLIKNTKRALETTQTNPFNFPISWSQTRKMAAFVVGFYMMKYVVAKNLEASARKFFHLAPLTSDCTTKQCMDLFSRSLDLLAAKLAWDRLGDEVKSLNRFIDAWAGYFYDQTADNAQKAYDLAKETCGLA